MNTIYQTKINGFSVRVNSDGIDTEIEIDSTHGLITIELEQSWIDFLNNELTDESSDDEKQEAVEMPLSTLTETTPGETFSHFTDAPDDNSIAATRHRTNEEMSAAKNSTIYRDVVTSLGQKNADDFCKQWGSS